MALKNGMEIHMGGPWVSFMVSEVYSLWHKGINRSVLLLFTVSVNNLISVPVKE